MINMRYLEQMKQNIETLKVLTNLSLNRMNNYIYDNQGFNQESIYQDIMGPINILETKIDGYIKFYSELHSPSQSDTNG